MQSQTLPQPLGVFSNSRGAEAFDDFADDRGAALEEVAGGPAQVFRQRIAAQQRAARTSLLQGFSLNCELCIRGFAVTATALGRCPSERKYSGVHELAPAI